MSREDIRAVQDYMLATIVTCVAGMFSLLDPQLAVWGTVLIVTATVLLALFISNANSLRGRE